MKHLTIQDTDGTEVEVLVVGNRYQDQWKNIKYGAYVDLTNFSARSRKHPCTKNIIIMLCAYSMDACTATHLTTKDFDEDFPLEDITITSLRACQNSVDHAFANLLVYVVKEHQVRQRQSTKGHVAVQEITVRDTKQSESILTLHDTATRKMKEGKFYLIKRAVAHQKKYRHGGTP